MADSARAGGAGEAPAVAVVGLATVFPGAGDAATYWRNIAGGADAIRDVDARRWDPEFFQPDPPAGSGEKPVVASNRIYCKRGGFVDEFAAFDPTQFGIMPLVVDWAEADQLLALRVASEAIADAGGDDVLGDRDRVGVVLGRGGYFGPGFARMEQRVKTATQLVTTLGEIIPTLRQEQLEAVREAFTAKLGPDRPEAAIGLVPNLAASRIANRLDLRGPAYAIDAACASSLIAVDMAVRDLMGGRADAMVVGGVHLVHEVTFWSVFTLLRALSPTQQIRPFDRRADGILIGEGIGMVVLKRLADAQAAGDRIYAVIRGVGTASDGRTSSLMAPAVAGQRLAVERAWADAGLDPTVPGALGLVEAHGTATPAGDAAELATLGKVFGASDGRPPIGIGSVKSMIGHAMPAAGAAGLIKAVLALHHRTLPPTLHCEEPHPAFAGTRFAPIAEATPWEVEPGGVRRAGVNAFGFGGINAHVVVEEAPDGDRARPLSSAFPVAGLAHAAASTEPPAATAPPLPPDPTAERVLLFSGATGADIARQLDVPDEDLLARDDAAAPPAGGPARLAIVAPTKRRLALARSIAARGTAWRGRNDLWFTPSPLLGSDGIAGPDGVARRGQLAFLFCGLEDKFDPRISDVCAHFGLPEPELDSTGQLGRHGVASVEVGRVLDAALRELGLVPDHFGGHSIGEWNAMISSGMISGEAVDDFIAGFEANSLSVPGVVFGALGCGAETAAEVIEDLPEIVVSHDNCPHQSIVCGREDSVATALERLRGRGVLGQVLPFQSGFHSPFLEPYLGPARESTADIPCVPVDAPVWSATTVERYPSSVAEIRALAIRHLLEPVRFRELAERLHAEDVRVFVQVGVGSVAGFVDDTLPGNDYLTVVTNTPKRSGLDQLRRVCAALWAEGAAPRSDRLPCVLRPTAISPAAMSPAAVSPAAGQAAVPPAHRPAAPARPNRSRLLNLGAPLVRLGDAARALLPPEALLEAAGADPAARVEGAAAAALDAGVDGEARTLGGRAGEHPVLAEFEAFVSDANALVSAVVDRWDTAGARPLPPARRAHQGTNGHGGNGHGGNGHATNGYDTRAPARSAPVVAPAEPAAVPQPLGPRTLTVTRTFSIDALPHVRDHCFYRQPPGWPHLVDRFPVIPMTALLEMMTDEARVFAPGRTAVGLRDVRALRWLAIEPAVEVTINLTELPDGAVRVEFKGYTRGTVVFADDYPPAPEPSAEALVDTRPPPVTASFLYEDGWMFHGPGYQGIHELGPISPGGLTGTVRAPDVPGALLDSVGQLFGFWGIPYLFSTGTSMMLPQGVGAIRFYGPQPPPGSPVTSTLWVRDVNDVTVKADFELRREDGSVWARIDGWTDHRFANDDVLWQMMRHPDVNTVAQRSDDGWMFAYEHATDSASRELISYHFLTVEGRALLAGRNPRAGRQWLLGRIAAHDAVRRFLWDHGAGPLWAIETQIDNEPSGRPVVARMPARPGIPRLSAPNVSLAHTQFAAVAMVHPDGEVGIDIEKVLPREPGVEAAGLTAAERALLDTLAGADPDARALWFTRMWSAKEAAAKADGTGLQGRPRRFVVDRIVDPAGEQSPDAPAMLPDAPAMLRVAIGGPAEQGQGQPAQGQPDGVAREGTRHRWVAHRLVDRVGLRMAAPSGGDCFVVAWTSPEIERAGQESDPREGVGA